MQGNSYFAKVTTAEAWKQDFDSVIGPKDELLKPIQNVLDKQRLQSLLEKYESFLSNVKEPWSNYKMPTIYAKKFEEEKAAATAAAALAASQAKKEEKPSKKDKKGAKDGKSVEDVAEAETVQKQASA